MINEKLIPYLVSSIQEYWDLPAFTDYPGDALSYADVGRRIMWMHRLFSASGMEKGSKIALAGKNGSNWAITWRIHRDVRSHYRTHTGQFFS